LLLIFDLDGTLIDSSQDLALSMNATREHFGMPPLNPNLIYSYVGNGVPVLVRRAFGPDAPEELVQAGIAFFRDFYGKHALDRTSLYPGIRRSIEQLTGSGHQLAILTNKPAEISRSIVSGLGVGHFFQRIYGGDSFPAKKPDPVGIETLVSELGAERADTMMIGDSAVDIQTGRNASVTTCGVAWGFQPETFLACEPDFLAHQPSDLVAYASNASFSG
jgi:phosphoglycolate phosphatase